MKIRKKYKVIAEFPGGKLKVGEFVFTTENNKAKVRRGFRFTDLSRFPNIFRFVDQKEL